MEELNARNFFECGTEEKEAVRLERFIKKQKNRKLIELLVNPEFTPVDSLALPIAIGMVRVPHVRDFPNRKLAGRALVQIQQEEQTSQGIQEIGSLSFLPTCKQFAHGNESCNFLTGRSWICFVPVNCY